MLEPVTLIVAVVAKTVGGSAPSFTQITPQGFDAVPGEVKVIRVPWVSA
jgi:hypothetical protein